METMGFKSMKAIRIGGMADTTIPIDSDVRDRLRAAKVGDDTYSEVINRLLDEADTDV